MSSSTIEKSVTIYRGDDELLLFSGVGPVTGLITLQVAAVFGGTTLLQSTSVDGEHGADHAAGKLAFPITAGQSASLPADSMLAYDVKIVDAGVTRSPFYGVFRVAGSITQTEFPVGMSANDVLSLLSDSSDSSKGAGLIGVLESFWSGVGFAGPFRLQGLLQWLYSKITPRIDPQTGGKLVRTIGTSGAIGESAVSESSGVLDAAGYLEDGNPFLGEHTTDELPEGSSNRYYTSARENAKANVDLTNVLNTDFYDKAVSSGAVGGGVASFNSRTGAVTPQAGDYSASQVSATETGDLSGTTVQAQLEDLDSRVGSNLWGPYPGLTTMHIDGPRKYATPSFPWHPRSETRTFSQTAAPEFFAALYSMYTEYALVSTHSITTAIHDVNYGDGVQLLVLDGAAPLYLRDEFAFRAYDFDRLDTPWFSEQSSRWWANFNPNISTEALTFTEDTDHRLQTGDPVVVVGGAQTNLLLGNIYYARRLTATTITLHPSATDAGSNANIINLTSSSPDIQLDLISGRSEIVFGLASDAGHVLAGNYRIMGIQNSSNILISGSNNTAGGSVSGSGRVYKFRVPGSTTTVKWHGEEDVAFMSGRANGTGSTASGIARLDQSQAHHHRYSHQTGGRGTTGPVGSVDVISTSPPVSGYLTDRVTIAISDGTNGTPRTGPRTRPRSVIVEPYIYVGANTLS